MIGKQTVQYGWVEMVSGLTTASVTGDGGLASSSEHVNPIAAPGLIYSSPNGTNMSTNLTDTLIASCEQESTGTVSYDRLYVDDTGGYYRQTGTNITKDFSGAQTTRYTYGITDMVAYDTDAYVTLTNDICKYAPNNSIDEDWWTNTLAQPALQTSCFHPMLVYESFLWIADGENLHYYDAGTVSAEQDALVLGEWEKITALGIDPGTGLMMIAVTNAFSLDQLTARSSFVYLFDGFSSKPRKKIPVDAPITAFQNVGGVVFCIMGETVGTWNGAGVTFLRKLRNSFQNLPYKHGVSSFENNFIVRDGRNVLMYGEVIPGKKVWIPILRNRSSDTSSTADYKIVTHTGEGKLTVSFSSSKAYQYSIDSTEAGTGTLILPEFTPDRPIFVRRIRVITTAVTTTSGIGVVGFYDQSGTVRSPTKATFGVSGATTYVHDFDYGGFKTTTVQPTITYATQTFGVKRVIVYYDVAE